MTTIHRPSDHGTPRQDQTVSTISHATAAPAPTDSSRTHRVRWNWFGLWAFLTAFAVFEVVKHGYVNGSLPTAALLTASAVGFFVAPDLTFLIGAGQPVEKGHLHRRAVPWYNAMHRISVPLLGTMIIGIALAPLALLPLAAFIGGLSWMAHIALDRAAGYGLRNPDGSLGPR